MIGFLVACRMNGWRKKMDDTLLGWLVVLVRKIFLKRSVCFCMELGHIIWSSKKSCMCFFSHHHHHHHHQPDLDRYIIVKLFILPRP